MNPVLLGILVYVAAQLALGLALSRSIATERDYLLAGRRFGYGLATFSIFATWFGAETCIGSAGAIYAEGLSGGSADPFGYSLCLLGMGLVFAVPLWRRGLTTLADLFRIRYTPGVERLAVCIMAPASLMWAAAQIRAFGSVLAVSSSLDLTVGVTVAAAVVIIYTASGGLLADAVTDVFQGIAIIVGLLLLLGVLLTGAAHSTAWPQVAPDRLQLFGGPRTTWLELAEAWAVPVCGSVIAQELIARVLASRSAPVARRSSLLAAALYLLVGGIPVYVGLTGAVLVPGLEQPEQILPLMAQRHLPTLLYVVFAGALVSAILSTVDSALLVAASLVSHNLLLSVRPGLSERAKLRAARTGVVVFGVLAYLLALHTEGVYALVEQASAFGSGGLFVVVVFALFSTWGGARSAVSALVIGMTVWASGSHAAWRAPYVASLLAAALAYGLVARWETPRVRA
jgi:Na+/proline symporter